MFVGRSSSFKQCRWKWPKAKNYPENSWNVWQFPSLSLNHGGRKFSNILSLHLIWLKICLSVRRDQRSAIFYVYISGSPSWTWLPSSSPHMHLSLHPLMNTSFNSLLLDLRVSSLNARMRLYFFDNTKLNTCSTFLPCYFMI